MRGSRAAVLRRVTVLGVFVLVAVVLPGTSVWATARSMASRAFVSVGRAIAPAFGMRAAGAGQITTAVASMTGSVATDADGDGKADPGDVIRYTTTITNTGGAPAQGFRFTDAPDPNTTWNGVYVLAPRLVDNNYQSTGNMTLNTGAFVGNCSFSGFSVLCNDRLNGATLAGFGDTQAHAGDVVPDGINSVTTASGGTVVMNANGSFVYNAAVGFTGTDTFWYTVRNTTLTPNLTATAQVSIEQSRAMGMVWFVSPSGTGDGRQMSPTNLPALQARNTLASPGPTDPQDGDTIFLLEGTHTAPLTLRPNQVLLGQDTNAPTGPLGPAKPGNDYPDNTLTPTVISGAAVNVTLSTDNRLAGFTAGSATSMAIAGTNVGTLGIRFVDIDNPVGGGFAITGSGGLISDSLYGLIPTITTVGGSYGVTLNNVSGGLTIGSTSTGGRIADAAIAGINVAGGDVNVTVNAIVQVFAGSGRLLSVSGGHTGTVTIRGPQQANAGAGVRFDNADGTYAYTGARGTTSFSSGATAGISIVNGSSGTFSFANNTSLNNPGGIPFAVADSNASVTFNGTITKSSTGAAISIDNHDSGTITFQTGTLGSTGSSSGIVVQNSNGGTIEFNQPTKTLSTGASTPVTLNTNNTGGTIGFGNGGLAITTTTGAGFSATGGGTVTVTGSGNSITSTSASALNVSNTDIGAGGLVFQSISSGNNTAAADPVNGIVLNNTGSVAGLTVTGDGATTAGLLDRNGSGGTIQNTTGDGVSLTNAFNVTLRQMTIKQAAFDGVESSGGGGIVLSAVDLDSPGWAMPGIDGGGFGTGNGWRAGNIGGVNAFDNNSRVTGFQSASSSGLLLQNTDTSFTSFTIDHALVTSSSTGGHGVTVSANGTTGGTVTLTSSEFTQLEQLAADIRQNGSGTLTAVVQKNSIHDASDASFSGRNGLRLALTGGGQLNFTVGGPTASDANTFHNLGYVVASNGIVRVEASTTSTNGARLNGSIQHNNFLNDVGFFNGTRAIDVQIAANGGSHGGHSILVADNTINAFYKQGINVVWQALNGGDVQNNNVTIRNNTLLNVGIEGNVDSGSAIEVEAFTDGAPNADLSANVLVQGNDATNNNGGTLGSTFEVNNGPGGSNTSVINLTLLDNLFTNLNTPSGEVVEIANLTGVAATCLDLNSGNANPNNAVDGNGTGFKLTSATVSGTFSIAGMGAATPSAFLGPRNQSNGASPATITASGAFVSSAACTESSASLRRGAPAMVVADNGGAGHSAASFAAWAGSIAALRTVPARETEITIPRARSTAAAVADVVSRSLAWTGRLTHAVVRSTGDVFAAARDAVTRNAVAPLEASGPVLDLFLGTLQPGETVIVVFEVTVEAPPVVSYQNYATISSTVGHFTQFDTNTVATNGDRYDTSTTVVSSNASPFKTESVTFTATVTATEGSGGPTAGTLTFDFGDGAVVASVACAQASPTTCSASASHVYATEGNFLVSAAFGGDTHHDPSTSNALALSVAACTVNPTVTNPTDGASGSLRDALANACPGSTIALDVAGFLDIGETGALNVARRVTIAGPGAGNLSIRRVSPNSLDYAVFTVPSGVTATIRGVTIQGGRQASSPGGGIDNQGTLTLEETHVTSNVSVNGGGVHNTGTLTVLNSTLSANTASAGGGAIFNEGAVTVVNGTISGNDARIDGGGILQVSLGEVVIVNSTITNNRADSDGNGTGLGGGMQAASGVAEPLLFNTIVAGNWRGTDGLRDDVAGALSSDSSHSLVGDGTGSAGVATGSNGNLVGNAEIPIDPRLGPLANNGGPTPTHALLAGSPAIDAGDNAVVIVPPFVAASPITDQRGTGFPRIADGADADTTQTVDIGAVEGHPAIEDVHDQTTAEETPLQFSFAVGDDLLGIDSVTATSSNPALVPNTGANLDVSGSGSSRTLTITPAVDQYGTATITLTATKQVGPSTVTATDTFVLAVTPLPDVPSVTPATTLTTKQTTSGLVLTRNAADGDEITHFRITNIANGLLFQNDGLTPIAGGDFITAAQGSAGLKFTPNNATATGSFDVQAAMDATTANLSAAATASITVNKHTTSTSVTVTPPDPTLQTQPVTIGYSVASATGGPAPTGTVTVTVSGGTETCAGALEDHQCTLVLTGAGVDRTVTATYSGDADSNGSFGTALHTVEACTINPVVSNGADDGPGSLREAIADVCPQPGSNTITFDGPSLNPVTLTTGELRVERDVVISGPGASSLTIRRHTGGGPFRIFHVAPNRSLAIGGVSIESGVATGSGFDGMGGAILAERSTAVTLTETSVTGNTAVMGGAIAVRTEDADATLTITRSTMSGNTATGEGGGVLLWGAGAGGRARLTLSDSTISGNQAVTAGGGVTLLSDATAAITNATIAGNSTTSGGPSGGGVSIHAGSPVILNNSIVAANTRSSVADDVLGDADPSSSHNLIGDGSNMTGIVNGVAGNQVGTSGDPISPGLGALADNGGATFTHALLPLSPAIDAGDNTLVVGTIDQRGAGFGRIKDGPDAGAVATADIGAFEVDPTVGDIPDWTTAEDTPLTVMFPVGDSTTGSFTAIDVTSSNQTLVPGANLDLTGSGAIRALTMTPVAGASGTTTITVAVRKQLGSTVYTATDTFQLTVTAVADTPSVTNATTPAQVQTTSGLVIMRNPSDGAEVTHFKITGIQDGTLFLNDGTTPVANGAFIAAAQGAAGLRFTPVNGLTGTTSFDVQASLSADDSGLGGSVVTAEITVDPHASTTTLVSANPDPSDRTQPVTVVYTVTSDGPAPTGTVTVSISGGSETCTGTVADGQCTLVPTGPGARDITATYSGDPITAGSAATLPHTVNNCLIAPIVNSTADDGGPGTLRHAVTNACFGNTVRFALDTEATITLGGSPIAIAKDLTIVGQDNVVRISGNHAVGIFTVGGGVSATLDRLVLVDGIAVTGGAVANSGTLRITNSTLSGNAATAAGGAIANTGHLTVLNSTFDGNGTSHAGGTGGAVYSAAGSFLTLTHVTITANVAAGGSGGGVFTTDDANSSITNSIIVGNSAVTGAEVYGSYAGDHNLTSGDPMLGPLQYNGGATYSREPQPGSPALDQGDNAAAAAAGLTTDQRGVPRRLDSADADTVQTVDIGAVEAVPDVEVLGDRTINENGTLSFTFNVGDAATGFEQIDATSFNTSLVPNDSAHISVSGSGSTRTLTVTPVPYGFGSAPIRVMADATVNGLHQTAQTVFTLTVNEVNDPPTMDPIGDVTVAEDSGATFVAVTGVSGGVGGETDIASLTATSSNPALVPNPFVNMNGLDTAAVRIVPLANKSGTAVITVTLVDGSGLTIGRTFTVTVTPVPDAPVVSPSGGFEDTESFPISIGRSARDGAEVTHFKITNITGGTLALFDPARTPVVSGQFITVAQGIGQLVFMPLPNSIVTGHFTVQASLSGSDAGLGGATTVANVFVDSVPDPPTVTGATTAEETQTTSGLVITRNAVDGADVANFRIVQIVNGTLFKSDGATALPNGSIVTAVEGAAGLRFRPASNFHGTASIEVVGLADSPFSGPIEGAPGAGAILVTPVADTPSITNAATIVNVQTTSGLVVIRNAVDGVEVTHVKVTGITGGTLFQNNGSTPIANGAFITMAQAEAGLKFTPATDSVTTGHITVQASTSASNGGLGGGLVTADITVGRLTPAVTLASSKNPANPGESVTFTATVAPSQAAASGTVQFMDGSTAIGSPVTIASGSASFTTSSLAVGLHTITAVYSGNTLALNATGTLSGGQRIRTPVTLSIASSGNPTPLGQSVTISATPVPGSGSGTPTGTMTFKEGATTLGSAALSGGVATFTTSALTLGTHHLAIDYGGDAVFTAAGGTFDQVTSCPVMTVGPATIAPAVAGTPYSQTFTQSGGVGTIAFSSTGALPPGLTFTAATATLGGTPTAPGSYSFDVTATPANGCGAVTKSYTLLVGGGRAVMTGADAGGGPHVRRFSAHDGSAPSVGVMNSFFAFNNGFTGGVRVAEGDVNGDGVPDPIAGAGPGGLPQISVFDGATGATIRTFAAFESTFTGGVFVAAGDVNGDGYADVVAGSGTGRRGQVKVFSGADGSVLRDTFVFSAAFTGGVRVAAGDVNGDGFADLIVAKGEGEASTVTVLSGGDLSVLRTFSPYGGFGGGVFVGAGDVTGDGFADVITGAGAGGGPHVQVFDGVSGTVVRSFWAFTPTFTGGVRVAAGDVTGDGQAEIIVGAGPGGSPEVRVFDGVTAAQVSAQLAYPAGFTGGVFVATVAPEHRMVIERSGPAGGAGSPGPGSGDRRPNMIAGWAYVENHRDAGISAIHVYAQPVSGGAVVFLGVATLGDPRPDVAAKFGAQYAGAGFHLEYRSGQLPLGDYDIVVFAQCAQTATFEIARKVRVTVKP